ncbi:MAG: response regulator [Anaerolineaceae bacterium]|nr:response regulator [Anaerolineaceae bacterium]
MALSRPVTLLIVDDIPETCESLKRMLQFDDDITVIGISHSGRDALNKVRELDPDVVLMDINMPDMDGITATQHIRQRYPYSQVVILSVQNDADYMRRAMRAGANDFLPKPPILDELLATIKRAGEITIEQRSMADTDVTMVKKSGGHAPRSGKTGKIITVYGPKGGVGSTTVTVNLAIGFRAKKREVCLIDANMQYSSLPVFMGEQSKFNILDLTPRVDELDPDVIKEVMSRHAATEIDILHAPQRIDMADHVTADDFVKLVTYLRRMYDYIVIDTSTALNDITLAALEMADINLLLSSLEITSLKNVNSFLMLYNALGFDRKRIAFVLNHYDRRSGITPERIGESLRQEVMMALPLDDKFALRDAVQRGVPVMLDNRTHLFSKNIYLLTNKLQAMLEKLEEMEL